MTDHITITTENTTNYAFEVGQELIMPFCWIYLGGPDLDETERLAPGSACKITASAEGYCSLVVLRTRGRKDAQAGTTFFMSHCDLSKNLSKKQDRSKANAIQAVKDALANGLTERIALMERVLLRRQQNIDMLESQVADLQSGLSDHSGS